MLNAWTLLPNILPLLVFAGVVVHAFEGSGELVEASGELDDNGSGEAPRVFSSNTVQVATEETLTSQELEVLRNIRVSELERLDANVSNNLAALQAASIDEDPLSVILSREIQNIGEKVLDDTVGKSVPRVTDTKPTPEQLKEDLENLSEIDKDINGNEATTSETTTRKVETVLEEAEKISEAVTATTSEPLKEVTTVKVKNEWIQETTRCEKLATCFNNSQCGKKGQCMGAFVGKCNCNACVHGRGCSSDKQCGGLNGACRDGRCGCAEVFAEHGMSLYIDVLTQFCNNKECLGPEDCFGLPCNPGRCYC